MGRLISNRIVRLLVVVAAIVGCVWGIRTSATFGLSKFFSKSAFGLPNEHTAARASWFGPNDAEAHFVNAAVLSLSRAREEPLVELERAVALRPSDFFLWSTLGFWRDQMGDTMGAIAAYDEAIKRAPFYSQPRWRRGNVLLRAGQYDRAFADLNHAAQSNPELVPGLIDLAWNVSKNDPNLTQQLVHIDTEQRHLAFAQFLARKNKPEDAIAQFRAAGNVPEDIRRELVARLIENRSFRQAFQIWNPNDNLDAERPFVTDGGFEGPLSFDEIGFGWRVPRDLPSVSVSLDSTNPHSGAKGLRIDFTGESNPGSAVVSQLMVVAPSTRYRINFTARTQDVVTGGLPIIVVDEAGQDRARLGRSAPISKGAGNWQVFTVDFTSLPSTNAVLVSLQRQNCSTSPCPMFGSITLDSFSIQRLK